MKWKDVKKAGQIAAVTGSIASTLQSSATDLPKPLADQYRHHAKEVRLSNTRRDTRDRLESSTRVKGQPTTTTQGVKELRDQRRRRR